MEVIVYRFGLPTAIEMTLAEATEYVTASNHCKIEGSSCDDCIFRNDTRCMHVGAEALTVHDEAAQRIVEASKKKESEEAI